MIAWSDPREPPGNQHPVIQFQEKSASETDYSTNVTWVQSEAKLSDPNAMPLPGASYNDCLVAVRAGISKGDVDKDGNVDLTDAILALQVIAGIEPTTQVYKEADVNGDGKIGIEEVIYILQKFSGLR